MADREMTYRPLGRCGTKVSTFGLGGWTTFGGSVTDEAATKQIILAAFEAGVNFFDIADVYAHGKAEAYMGKVLADLPRHELVISSKCYWPMSKDINDRGLSRKHIMESVEKSLKRVGTDYLDIYFCHRYDTETPLDETVRAMDDLVRQGKVLYWGTSEWTADQLHDAHKTAAKYGAYAPQVEQPQYHLLARENLEANLGPATQELGMGVVVWSPLASGLLTGKYDDALPEDSRLARMDWLREKLFVEDKLAAVREMATIADELGCSRAQLALAFAAKGPSVSSVILGATRLEQLEDNLGALAVELDDTTLARLQALFPAA